MTGVGWLRGRVAVVTGASSGIGRATAIALGGAGAHVVLAARREDELAKAASEIEEAGGQASAVPTDVTRPGDVERLFERAEAIGPPAVLVYAAGALLKATVEDTTEEVWRDTLAANLDGAFRCARRAFLAMRDSGGRIVLISSLSGLYGTEKFPGLLAYNVSKHGLVGLAEGLAVEGRPHGISAICVSPGAVDSGMLRVANPDLRPGLTPQDVARLIVALLDEAMAPAAGANIPLFSNR